MSTMTPKIAGCTRFEANFEVSNLSDRKAGRPALSRNQGELRRYNLALPTGLYEDLQAAAEERGTTVVELLRRFIKLGLLALELESDRDAALIVREGDRERQILLI